MANPGPASTVSNNTQLVITTQAGIRLLSVVKGVIIGALGDTLLPILQASAWTVSNVVMANASVALTGSAGVFTGPAGTGTAIVAAAALTGLTSNAIVSQRTVATTNLQNGTALYLNVSAAQAGAPTVDVYVYGYDLS